MSGNLTSGDLFSIECPHCGEEICDLWDGGGVKPGEEVECCECRGKSVVEDYEVTITLRATGEAKP